MIFDFKCNETGVSCHQKEPKNFGPVSFGPKAVDLLASEVLGSIFTVLDGHERWLSKSIHKNGTFIIIRFWSHWSPILVNEVLFGYSFACGNLIFVQGSLECP